MTEAADLMVLSAHPDDAEVSCGGTILRATDGGARVVLVDLSLGEQATRGTPELRQEEAEAARKLLGAAERVNLQMPDTRIASTNRALACSRSSRVRRFMCARATQLRLLASRIEFRRDKSTIFANSTLAFSSSPCSRSTSPSRQRASK